MAPIESPPPNARAIAAWPNFLAALFVFMMFVSLRLLEDTAQKVGLVLAWVSYAGLVAGRLRGRFAADADGKRLLLLVGGPADALLLIGAALCEWAVFGTKVPSLVMPTGIVAMITGASITLALELAAAPMRATGFVDNRRVQSAARTAATLVCAVAGVSALCFGVEKLDIRRDYSFAAPTAPSASTLSVLESASCIAGENGATAGKPELFLFYERGSPGLGEIRDYFDVLQKKGARVVTMDSAFDPALAKSLKVSKNGTVGFRCGGRTDTYNVGDDREEVQRKIGKLDEEVRTRLVKLMKDPAIVYFTVGHGERSADDVGKPGERVSAKNLKKVVEAMNGKVKKLGVGEGLSKEVPADAALVVIAGPTAPFLGDEANALATYVKNGGSLLLLLDPKVGDQADVTATLDPLLAAMNLKVGEHEVLNDKAFVQNTHTDADHAFLYSQSFGSHKSVKTLSGARGKAALLFLSAATVEKRDPKADEKTAAKVTILARTPAGSFVDQNDDRKWDEKSEARAILDLAAAVEMPKAGDKEGRAIVVGDSDVLGDMLIVQDANYVFGSETLLWLLRDDDKISAEGVKPDEDVAIKHTRDEDTVWFYATIFAGPVVCLAGGLTFVRLKRRRKVDGGRDARNGPSTTGGAA